MGTEIAYTPRQVTLALQQLALDFGNVETTAEKLINDEFQVPALTLLAWKLEEHAEQYGRIADQLGAQLERGAITQLQETIIKANEGRLELIERVALIERPELVSQALRALSDASAKASTELMQLTGRPTDGRDGDASVDAMIRLVTSLQGAGLINVAPAVAATLAPTEIEEVTEVTN